MTCSICTEDYNKTEHSIVECNSCAKTACKCCVRTYLLSIDEDPKCMFCKNPYSNVFMSEKLNKTWFYKTYKAHYEKVLLDRQVSQLPETQDKAVRVKESRKHQEAIQVLMEERKELTNKLKKINSQIMEHTNIITTLVNTTNTPTGTNFNFKCSHAECNGFVNSSWLCQVCDKKTCKDCLEPLTEDHECDKDKLDTVKLIKRDTKPCPGCGEMINKIDGCDQMWCPGCKVAFSWKSGQIEKGQIHNPEYYRWMRETNQDIPRAEDYYNNGCGPAYQVFFLRNTLSKVFRFDFSSNNHPIEVITFCDMHRFIGHIAWLETIFQNGENTNNNKQEQYRISYILGEIDKNTWKNKLYAMDKARKKQQDIINVFQLLRTIIMQEMDKSVELCRTVMDNTKEEVIDTIRESLVKLEKLRNFANNSLENIAKNYNVEEEIITPEWRHTSKKMYLRL